jgi:uncharacterized membrane protein
MKKAFILSLIITALEFAAAMITYQYLPEVIPRHWDLNGAVDGYANRLIIFLTPATSLVLTFGMYYLPNIVPKGDNIKKSGKSYPVLMVAVNLLMAVLLVITTIAAFGFPILVNTIIFIALGVLMLLVGNYMPKIKHNYIFGIRLPWTLASELVWAKTHRFGGKVFFAVGLLIIAGAFVSAPINFIILFAGLLLGVAVIIVYAGISYTRNQS